MTTTDLSRPTAPGASAGLAGAMLMRPRVFARRGVISTANPLAAQAGMAILRRGGNAIDAALATAAVLVVVEPHMSHLGGDAFIQVYDAERNEVIAFNSNGPAPYNATQELFAAHGIPDRGPLSASVPGVVDGWFATHGRYATLPMTTLLEAAIDYAEHGFPVSAGLSNAMKSTQAVLAQYPASAAQFLKDGRPYEPGEVLRQPDLARSLKLIAEGGRAEYYSGAIAESVWRWSQREGALFGLRDFAEFEGEITRPVTTTYRGVTVCENPPTSQGYLILQALNLLEPFDLGSLDAAGDEAMHLKIEALRLAMTDRLAFAGDPRYVDNHIPTLISKEYAKRRGGDLNRQRASATMNPGPIRGGDTTYFCIVDQQGNAVSWMQSLFQAFGSGVVVPSTGMVLNNRMTGFSTDPKSPNVVAGGKRTVHTLNTYMVLRDGKPVFVGGSPGGMLQVQTNLQILTGVFDHGLNVQSAIEAPRWNWNGDVDVTVENRAPAETIKGLVDRGYRAAPMGPWAGSGRVAAIQIDRQAGVLVGGADPRAENVAVGY